MNDGNDMLRLTKRVKLLAKRHGAVLVGIAPIERFDLMPPFYDRAPKGHDPRDFLPGAKAVISFAMPILDSVLYGSAEAARRESEMLPPDIINQFYDIVYNEMGHGLHDKMLQIFIDTPAKSDPQLCMRRQILTDKEPVRGECLRVCPLPINNATGSMV